MIIDEHIKEAAEVLRKAALDAGIDSVSGTLDTLHDKEPHIRLTVERGSESGWSYEASYTHNRETFTIKVSIEEDDIIPF